MFALERLGVTLRTIKLKLAADDDDDGNIVRLCECTFRVPILDYDLAAKVRLPIVQHCFGRDHLPQWAVSDVHFAPPEDTFTATLRPAPDAPITATFELAKVTKVRVWRPNDEKRDLAFEFVTQHVLGRGDLRDLADLFNAWEGGLTQLALDTVQIPLPMEREDDQPRREHSSSRSTRRTH